MTVNVDSDVHLDDFPEDEKQALLGFHASLRRVLAVHGLINPGVEKLQELTARIDALADELESMPRGRPFLRFTGRLREEDPNETIPFSPISGRFNALALPLELRVEGHMLIGEGTFNEAIEGPNRCIHGGFVAAIYDQMLAQANLVSQTGGPTASLSVFYKKPTPLHVPLRFEAWMESTEGRKILTKGRCFANGELISEAEGVFIRLDPTRSYPQWSNRVQSHDGPAESAQTNEG